jgi:alpha-amylase
MPAGAEGRFFTAADGTPLGDLGSRLDIARCAGIGLVDGWLGIDARLALPPAGDGTAAGLWTFPIRTVSQSEGGFELVHQSVVVMPHWIVTPDARGAWRTEITLDLLQTPTAGQDG